MSSRWIEIFSCVTFLTISHSLFGWGNASTSEPLDTPHTPVYENKTHFPLADNQQWFVKESYLILKPYEDDSDYAVRLTTQGTADTQVNMKMKLEKPDFDWYSGVRLGVGRYLPHHDKWDITLFTTYFYANEKDSSNPSRADGTLLTPLWIPTFDGAATKASTTWRMNFFNWDLSLGREFSLLKTIVAHPFIGIRAALIYKKYRAYYSDKNSYFITNRTLNDNFKAKDTFWGIGPRAGVDFDFKFQPGWSFLGNLSAALFYGNYDVTGAYSTSITTNGLTITKNYHNSDNQYCVRANLDAALGLGWEAWFKNHTLRLAPSILFEASCWFDTNQYFLSKSSGISSASNIPSFQNFRRQGNLILMGFSFNLQTDF